MRIFFKQSFKQKFETKLRFLVELQLNGKKYKVRNSDFLKNFRRKRIFAARVEYPHTVAFRYIFFFVRKISNNYNNNKCVPDIYSSKAKILIREEVKIGSVALTLNEFLRGNFIVRNYEEFLCCLRLYCFTMITTQHLVSFRLLLPSSSPRDIVTDYCLRFSRRIASRS